MPRFVVSAVAVAVLAWLSGCAAPDEKEASADLRAVPRAALEPLSVHLDTQISQYMGRYGRGWPTFRFHGVVLVARGEQIAVHRAFGLADLLSEVPNETTTRFRLGTLSAQFVSAAIMRLSDLGKLSLADTVRQHLPGYPGGGKITVEQLLTHTSGIPNFTDLQTFGWSKHIPATLDALLASFSGLPLEHTPGAQTTPSNSNYVLLSAIVEAASDSSFESFIEREILTPLGMTSTEFASTASQQAIGLQYNEAEHLDVVQSVHPAAFGAAGGYLSTAHDLFRFNRALAADTLLLPQSRDAMMGLAADIGYAWVTQSQRGRRLSGWPGLIDGMNSSVLHEIEDETVVIVLANTEVVSAGEVARDIMTMIYGGELPEYSEPREVPVALTDQASAAGHYVIARKTERIIEATDPELLDTLGEIDIAVAGESLMLVIPGRQPKRMHPSGEGQWFFKDLPRTTARFVVRSDGGGRLHITQPGHTAMTFVLRPSIPSPP